MHNYSYTDWRLPTKEELEGFLSTIHKYPVHLIPFNNVYKTSSSGFIANCIYYCDGCYVSSTPHPNGAVWGIGISSEGIPTCGINSIYKNGYLWPVRAGRKIEEEKRKFKDNGNGTVTDNDTKLMWQQGENDVMEWDSAIAYCKGLPLAGYNDWRLPSIDELKSIVDVKENPTINKTYFPNANSSYYLSSTTAAYGTTGAWSVGFGGGNVGYGDESGYGFVRCIRGGQEQAISHSTPSIPDTQSKDEELQKLKTFIADQWKLVAQIPPPKRDWRELVTLKITGKYDDYSSLYLFGVNMRGRASDAFASADKFLKKGDFKNAQKYADLGTRYYIESENLFKASGEVFSGSVSITAQILEAAYRGPAEASKYGWGLMCGPKCYEVADYVFLLTDFAMDYGLEGMDEAKKNLIAKAFVKTLLKMGGISSWIENRTTHLIGGSGLYGLMDKTINSPEFQKAFMKVVAESGAYSAKKLAEAGAKKVIQNSLVFVKGSSNLKPEN